VMTDDWIAFAVTASICDDAGQVSPTRYLMAGEIDVMRAII
jgi:hypothetical protein